MIRRLTFNLVAVWLALCPPVHAQVSSPPADDEAPVARALPADDDEEDVPEAKPVVEPTEQPTQPAPRSKPTPRPTAKDEDEVPEARPVAPVEDVPEAKPVIPGKDEEKKAATKDDPAVQASMRTQADAQTVYITLPAPRGQIIDRNGIPLAQNILAYYPAVKFPEGKPMSEAEAIRFAQARIANTAKLLGIPWTAKDSTIAEHYKYRRWLPLLCEKVLKEAPSPEIRARLPQGVILHPAYLRTYPQGRLACHIIGSVGKVRGMASGPLDPTDPYFPEMLGRDGLEQAYEEQLNGTTGQLNMLFDPQGAKITEEITRKPVSGDTLVTTLDAEFQKICEDVLEDNVRRGAFVIIDVNTGEVLSLASWPMYDPNLFVPSIEQKVWDKLSKDEDKPMRGRAFMDVYPPASTFKVITALAGLETGKITEHTTFDCNPALRVGNRWFKNWTTRDFGPLDMTGAIKLSCNTWFYRAAPIIGSKNLGSMASRFGFGERTGLPIRGEAAGRVADDEYMIKYEGRRVGLGDLTNMVIGQGPVSATPLQVARAMAGIANGEYVPNVRLVSQIQDLNNQVIEAFPPSPRNELRLKSGYIKSIHKGMRAVVEAGDGTGKAAANRYVSVAGKTGTAQWTKGRHMAWFAGFLPAKDPQYAFAAIYEGEVGESGISGGKKVAPLVSQVFNRVYKLKKERDEPMSGPRTSPLAQNKKKDGATDEEAGDDDEDDGDNDAPTRSSRRVASNKPTVKKAEPAESAPAPPKETGVRGFFKRLFGRQ